jgi:hypothetical protein
MRESFYPCRSHVVPYFGDFVCRTTASDPLLPCPFLRPYGSPSEYPSRCNARLRIQNARPVMMCLLSLQRLSRQPDEHGYPGRFSHGRKQTFPPMIRSTFLASLHCDHRTGNLDCSGQLNFILRFRIRIVLTNGGFLERCSILQVKCWLVGFGLRTTILMSKQTMERFLHVEDRSLSVSGDCWYERDVCALRIASRSSL